MITLEDCAAFCDADPERVHEMACRDALPMVSAFAKAHATTLCANDARIAREPSLVAPIPVKLHKIA